MGLEVRRFGLAKGLHIFWRLWLDFDGDFDCIYLLGFTLPGRPWGAGKITICGRLDGFGILRAWDGAFLAM